MCAEAQITYEPVDEIESAESLQYNFEIIRDATDQFSEENKLGQGGFGAVYKVKNLSTYKVNSLFSIE